MSILVTTSKVSFIDHRDFLCNIYKNVELSAQEIQSYSLLSELFSIRRDKKAKCRKRKHNSEEVQEEFSAVKENYEKSLKELSEHLKSSIHKKYNLANTEAVRELSKQLFEATVFDHSGVSGGNNSEKPLKCTIKEESFLIPPYSRFFCGCVQEQCKKLKGANFDIVVADPPWWNKFIRRLKSANDKLSYNMMYNEDIASIPVKDLLSPNCLIAVWCTNSPSNISAVKDLIFPSWGITYVTTWYWMKVSIDLEPVCDFGSGHQKQPFERLILGKVGQLKKEPDDHMVMSVPSALHSHKPPLLDLLSPYVEAENPEVLELFARYLLPNTSSVGYEPLKWQHISLYETVVDNKMK